MRCLEQFSTYEPENRDDLFMYPFLLMVLGMLHVLYNALQEGVTGTPGNQEFLVSLRAMEAFFSSKTLRDAFIATCCVTLEERELFQHYSTVHVDWKWEFMSRALNRLVPLLRIFVHRFDARIIMNQATGIMVHARYGHDCAKHHPERAAFPRRLRDVPGRWCLRGRLCEGA